MASGQLFSTFALGSILVFALVGCPPDEEKTDDSATETGDTGPVDDGCTAFELNEGSTGTYTVNSAGDDHVKHHFDMPEGIARVKATVTWTTGWNMVWELGTGWCPHSGTSLCEVSGSEGTLSLDVTATDLVGTDTFTADDQWFAHLGLDMMVGPEDGETADYTMAVEVCPAAAR